ncbi:hypothetical protein [Streptomyces sp. NPDC050535]|uniref:hypothetical protein n=1 Tax=Streptomyces sp. NPDC050535 TaxID=3365626 RepID=UPI0037BC2BE3
MITTKKALKIEAKKNQENTPGACTPTGASGSNPRHTTTLLTIESPDLIVSSSRQRR